MIEATLHILNKITALALETWAASWVTVGFWKILILISKVLVVLLPLLVLYLLLYPRKPKEPCSDFEGDFI